MKQTQSGSKIIKNNIVSLFAIRFSMLQPLNPILEENNLDLEAAPNEIVLKHNYNLQKINFFSEKTVGNRAISFADF